METIRTDIIYVATYFGFDKDGVVVNNLRNESLMEDFHYHSSFIPNQTVELETYIKLELEYQEEATKHKWTTNSSSGILG